MDISAISFKGGYNDGLEVPNWINSRHPQNRRGVERSVYASSVSNPQERAYHTSRASQPHLRNLQQDTYTPTRKSSRQNTKQKQQIIPKQLKAFAAGVLAALAVTQGAQVVNQPSEVVSIPADSLTSLTEIAQTYDSDIDAILNYNDVVDEADLSQLDEVKVPSNFDYLQDEIDSLQAKLYSGNLSPEERVQIEDKIAQYQEKQELQQSIASVYTDGKFVYYTIVDVPEDIGFSGINVEKFKDIFDIKDGALKKYNDIEYTWARDPEAPPEDDGYRDYTVASLKIGDTVKVRQGDIQPDANE